MDRHGLIKGILHDGLNLVKKPTRDPSFSTMYKVFKSIWETGKYVGRVTSAGQIGIWLHCYKNNYHIHLHWWLGSQDKVSIEFRRANLKTNKYDILDDKIVLNIYDTKNLASTIMGVIAGGLSELSK